MEVLKTPITRHFNTGAVRGEDGGRGKPSLLPFEAVSMISRCWNGFASYPMIGLIEVSKIYEAGSKKYEARNWEKGMPFSAYVDSTFRHFQKYQNGDQDEPHVGQFAWNILCLLQTYIWFGDGKLPANIADMPLVDTNIDKLRKEPLPSILSLQDDPLLHHTNMAICCLAGFCYGKHPINLAAAAAHAIMVVDIETRLARSRAAAVKMTEDEFFSALEEEFCDE